MGCQFYRYGEDGVRVVFGKSIDEGTNQRVINFYRALTSQKIKGVFEAIPSFSVCLVRFDASQIDYDSLLKILKEIEARGDKIISYEEKFHEIPVRYGGKEGPDLPFVASYSGLTEEEVIEIHSSTIYRVFTIGFIPGFPYLGTIDRKIFSPRLATPRTKVPEGSVGIAQLQTGIYPFESPGGWQIIGRTDVRLFDYKRPPYSLLQIGDRVKFIPV